LAEQEDRIQTCLRDEGIRIEPSDESPLGYMIDTGGLDRATYDSIKTACTERAGGYPQIIPTTRKELSSLYDLHIETKKCLETQGVAVKDPPSREKWIEDSLSNPEGPWLPYESSGAFGNEDVCPDAELYRDVYGVDLYGRG
jgi:hypothetical protein